MLERSYVHLGSLWASFGIPLAVLRISNLGEIPENIFAIIDERVCNLTTKPTIIERRGEIPLKQCSKTNAHVLQQSLFLLKYMCF